LIDLIREYHKGCGWEIYVSKLSKLFVGYKFCELSFALYEKKGVVLFALQVQDKIGGSSRLLLNPADFVIPEPKDYHIEAFVIAQNQADADLTLNDKTDTFSTSPDYTTHLSSANHNHHSNNSSSAPNTDNPSDQPIFQRMNRNLTSFAGMMRNASSGDILGNPKSSMKTLEAVEEGHDNNNNNNKDNKQSNTHKKNDGNNKPESEKKKVSKWKLLQRSALLERKVKSNNFQEIMHRLEEDHFKENYYVVENPLDIHECTVSTSILEEYPFINQHIVIIGKGLRNLFDLIRPLRARYLGSLRYIVLLYPYDIPHDVWQRISVFDAILFVRGSPLEEANLRRAGIFRASQVVVLADGIKPASGNPNVSSGDMDALVDADAIFAYQHVKRMNPSTQVVIEVVNQSNISYLNDQTEWIVEDPKFTPQFAAGVMFTTSLLDTIVCQVN
jgi:hypothetical protein